MKNPQKVIWLIIIAFLGTALILFWWVRNTSSTFCRMSVDLYNDVLPQELLSPPGRLEAGQEVEVVDEHLTWVLVRSGPFEGWLPEWYLSRDAADLLTNIAPYLMVLKEKAPVYLYPGQETAIADLAAGKVVEVESEYNNWRYVHIAVYDMPKVQRGWVLVESLATREEVDPLEGKLPVGTKIYYGPNAEKCAGFPEEIDPIEERIHVIKEIEDMAYVQGPGGWNAWVYKKDIIYDPF